MPRPTDLQARANETSPIDSVKGLPRSTAEGKLRNEKEGLGNARVRAGERRETDHCSADLGIKAAKRWSPIGACL